MGGGLKRRHPWPDDTVLPRPAGCAFQAGVPFEPSASLRAACAWASLF